MELFDREIMPDGTINEYYYDEGSDQVIVRTIADATAVLEANKNKRNWGNNGFTKDRTMREIATIDMAGLHRFMKEMHVEAGDPDEHKKLKIWLRRPENAYYRTASGKF